MAIDLYTGEEIADTSPASVVQQNSSAPFYKQVIPDIVSGLATGGQKINQFLNNSLDIPQNMRPQQIDMQQLFGAPKPTSSFDPHALIQGAAEYSPYAVGSGLGGIEEGIGLAGRSGLPYLARGANALSSYLSRSPVIAKAAQQFLPGAVGGAISNTDDPVKGAEIGAPLNTLTALGLGGIAKGAGMLAGAPSAINSLGNMFLNKIRGDMPHAGALSPEETGRNIASNYTDQFGKPVSMDIGTLTNNPLTSNLYGALKYSPFSGVSKQMNVAKSQLADKAMADTQNQMDALGKDPVERDLRNKILEIGDQEQQHAINVQSAPNVLNSLKDAVPTDSTPASYLKGKVYNSYDAANKESKKNFEPINNSDFRIDKLGLDNPFPSYGSAVKDLLAERENMANLFGANDLSGQLQKEISKGSNLINNSDNWGATLPEVVKRVQSLGQLAAAAKAQGNLNEGRLLSNMATGLRQDTTDLLKNNGRKDLSDQWDAANEFHKNNVIPFYQTPEIRQSIASKDYIPNFYKLSKELHNPNNGSILQKLSPEDQKTGLYGLISGNKGTSSGVSNLTPAKIGSTYSRLDPALKAQVATYHPEADKYFENLPSDIENHKALTSTRDVLSKQLESINKSNQSTQERLNEQLLKQQSDKFGASNASSASANAIPGLVKTGLTTGAGIMGHTNPLTLLGTVPAIGMGRTIAQALRNPALINAYLKGTNLPSIAPKGLGAVPYLSTYPSLQAAGN